MKLKKDDYLDIIKAMMMKSQIDEFYLSEQEIKEASEFELYKVKCEHKFGNVYKLVKKELRLKENLI